MNSSFEKISMTGKIMSNPTHDPSISSNPFFVLCFYVLNLYNLLKFPKKVGDHVGILLLR